MAQPNNPQPVDGLQMTINKIAWDECGYSPTYRVGVTTRDGVHGEVIARAGVVVRIMREWDGDTPYYVLVRAEDDGPTRSDGERQIFVKRAHLLRWMADARAEEVDYPDTSTARLCRRQ
jgi:hypothetical protein